MRGGAQAVAVLAVAGLGVFMAGCSSDGPSSSGSPEPVKASVVTIDGVPFLAGATHGAGAELRDGLKVVEGSRLLADVFPSRNAPTVAGMVDDRGWFASILITGDPRQVLPAYARQATQLDLPVPEVRCSTSTADDDSPPVISCTGRSVAKFGVRVFELDYQRRSRGEGTQPLSHLTLHSVDPVGATAYAYPDAGLEPLDTIAVQNLPWGSLPVLGQGFEAGTANQPAMAVMEGVHVVGPAGPDGTILRVDGDLDKVVLGYLGAGDSISVTTRRQSDDGVHVVERHWTNGDTYSLTTYQRAGRPTWLVAKHTSGD